MFSAEEVAGAHHRLSRRARRARVAALITTALTLVALMQLPGAAQDQTTSSTADPTPSTTAPTTPTTEATTATTAPASAPTTAGGETTTTAASPTSQAEAPATTILSAEDKARLDAAAAAKAREVDAANARLDDLSNALGALNSQVKAQSGKVDYANEQLAAAEVKVKESEAAVAQAKEGLAQLELRLQNQAIRNFMGDDSDQAAVLITGDPNQSIRMQAMLAEVTQSDIDLSATLVSAQEDLEVQQAEALNAVDEAEALRATANDELAVLEGDRRAQSSLTMAAESRLDHLLSERAALGSLGAGAEGGAGAETSLVNALLNSSGSTPPPNQNVAVPAVVDESSIRLAGNGIRVNVSIVEQVQALLVAAEAAGYNLAGGGYRDPAAQIATRKSNCGTSNYAIYEMPASQCSPPTARPGQSMHERGLAIDFTSNGQLIRSRSNAAWVWLNNNAATYGLCNLPSEPWHWSTNCK